MRKGVIVLAGGLALLTAGCQPVYSPVGGVIYADVMGPVTATSSAATKEGKSCARSILGLIATGDASIAAAKKAGGITEVSSVDHHSTNILGIIADFCTIVKGK
jgi:hypothetical protein